MQIPTQFGQSQNQNLLFSWYPLKKESWSNLPIDTNKLWNRPFGSHLDFKTHQLLRPVYLKKMQHFWLTRTHSSGTRLHRTLPKAAYNHCLPCIKEKCQGGREGGRSGVHLQSLPVLPKVPVQEICFPGRSRSPRAPKRAGTPGVVHALQALCEGESL